MINIKHSTRVKTMQTRLDIIYAALEQPELASKILSRVTSEVNSFNKISGCYLMYQGDNLVYAGVSCNIAGRIAQHISIGKKKWDSIKYVKEECYADALKIEAFFIHNYNPMYNKAAGHFIWANMAYEEFDENKLYCPGWSKKKTKFKLL